MLQSKCDIFVGAHLHLQTHTEGSGRRRAGKSCHLDIGPLVLGGWQVTAAGEGESFCVPTGQFPMTQWVICTWAALTGPNGFLKGQSWAGGRVGGCGRSWREVGEIPQFLKQARRIHSNLRFEALLNLNSSCCLVRIVH